MTFTLTSASFSEGAMIPRQHTCDGADRSPPLRWEGAPPAASYVLIMDDPDAPGGTFTHWVLYDIPGTRTELAEGEQDTGLAGGTILADAAMAVRARRVAEAPTATSSVCRRWIFLH